MRHVARKQDLATKAFQRLFVGSVLRPENLDRDMHAQHAVVGLVDDARRALADPFDELVALVEYFRDLGSVRAGLVPSQCGDGKVRRFHGRARGHF